jgi:hypothetical protein
MRFPQEAVRACDELYERNKPLAHSDSDDDRRQLTRLIAEQVAFALGDRWGCKKRTGLGDEWRSKDAIAYREDDGTASVWDWQSGATRRRVVGAGDEPTYPHLSLQEAAFIPVAATNHLGWQPGDPIHEQPARGGAAPIAGLDDATRGSINEMAAKLSRIEATLAGLRQALQSTDDRVERTYQDLKNRIDAIGR